MRWRDRFAVLLARDSPISVRRVAVIVVLSAVASGLGAAPGLLNRPDFGWPALIVFVVLTAATGLAMNLVLNLRQPPVDPVAIRAQRTLIVLSRSARAIPQQRQAPALSEFRGREAELAHWASEHKRLRRERTNPAIRMLRPVVLAVHGPPGVGKSMLTQALARRLADEYKDGYFIASFGASGTARGPADIARDLLLQLGWPEVDMPTDTEDRVATIRSLTRNKQMLFLFDAVRDHDQVRALIPAEPGCTVILSSRREIGSSLSLPPRPPIRPTSISDSLQILSAISGIEWTRDAETAIETIELCGRLPLALRSVAERIRDGEGIRYVAALLRPANARLRALDYGGRSIRERIKSEFDRLTNRQRAALKLLATMDSDTFVPWVLRPLMSLEQHESTTLMAGLAAAQFAEEVTLDGTGQARYRLHPLMRAYARHDLTTVDSRGATERLNDAYIDLIDDVLAEQDPTYHRIRTGPRRWRSEHSTIAPRIVAALDQILPYEYLNLVRIIHAARLETHAPMIWRVAALLDGRIPALAEQSGSATARTAQVLAAFRRGIDAARECGTRVGVANVRLACAQFLVAIERYHDAREILAGTPDVLDGADGAGDDARVRLRAYRVEAWSHVQRGAYADADEILARADDVIDSLPDDVLVHPYVQTDVELVDLYKEEAHRIAHGPRGSGHPRPTAPAAIVEFRWALRRTETLRRQGNWQDAATDLRLLLAQTADVRGRTAVLYRLARLLTDEVRHLGADDKHQARRARLIREAVEHAAACVVAFGSLGNVVGQIRGRCLLMRTLVMAGNRVAAMQLALEAEAEVKALESHEDTRPYTPPLRARYERARAEVELAHGRLPTAWTCLTDAAQTFRELRDWSSHADTWRVLDQMYRDGDSPGTGS